MITRTDCRSANGNRAAFTLPELLVVVTVTLILMSILVQASTIITNTVSEAKSQGDFVGQERMMIAVMRRDLQCDHFLEEDGNTEPGKGRKLSDWRSDRATLSADSKVIENYKPPKNGYFWARSRPVPATGTMYDAGDIKTWNVYEGQSSLFDSTRSENHFMQFTIVMPGGSPSNTLTADVPFKQGSTITATCAEVGYFLVPNGQTPNGTRKYKLIRRQRLVARNTDDAPAYNQILNRTTPAPVVTDANDPPEVMAVASPATVGNFKMLNLNDLSSSNNRLGVIANAPRQPISALRIGEDVLHNHVTSFEIKFTGSGPNWPLKYAQNNTDFPYDTLPYDHEYDTGNETMASVTTGTNGNLASTTNTGGTIKPIRITGVQIRLRCWNPSNKQTRQTTTAVDL